MQVVVQANQELEVHKHTAPECFCSLVWTGEQMPLA